MLRCSESLEVLVVYNNVEPLACPLQLRPPFFQRFDDREKLLIVDVVIVFLCRMFGAEICH